MEGERKKERKSKRSKGGFAAIPIADLLAGRIEFSSDVGIDDVPEPEDVRERTKAELKRLNLAVKPQVEEFDAEAHAKKYFETLEKGGGHVVSGVNRRGENLEMEKLKRLLEDNVCYDDIAVKMECLTPDGGVRKLIMEPGIPGNPVEAGQVVYIRYQVWTEGSDAPLDDSRTHSRVGKKSGSIEGTTYRFKVGCGNVLPAMDIAVQSMQIREVAKILAEAKYAYGKLGVIGSVPPDTRAMLTIELVEVAEGTATVNFVDLDPKERMHLPFNDLIKGIVELKQYGKDYVEQENFSSAKKEYKTALQITHDIIRMTEEEMKQRDELRFTILNNLGFCCMKLGQFRRAREYLEQALEMETILKTKKTKAYYRLGKTLFELGDLDEAKKNIDAAKNLDPSNKDVQELFNTVCAKILEGRDQEVEYVTKMFKNF